MKNTIKKYLNKLNRKLYQYLLHKFYGYKYIELNTGTSKHYILKESSRIAGFATEYAAPGSMAKVLTCGVLTSDEKDFYLYINQIHNIYLNKYLPQTINAFLVISHEDNTSDVYMNNIPIILKVRIKRSVKANQFASKKDVLNIIGVSFPGINFKKTDNVIICIKVGWKFGLIFNLSQSCKGQYFDETEFKLQFTNLYNYLLFQDDLEVARNAINYNELLKDGWFPFIQFGGGKYAKLASWYMDKEHKNALIDSFISEFKRVDIDEIISNWWSNEIFMKKKELLMAGIDAFFENNPRGYIKAIKSLYPEIEGILREAYHVEKHREPKIENLLSHLSEKANKTFSKNDIMVFSKEFIQYLRDVFFRRFDIEKGDVVLSRHSLSHGMAEENQYSQARAFQAILILDQIYFFMGKS